MTLTETCLLQSDCSRVEGTPPLLASTAVHCWWVNEQDVYCLSHVLGHMALETGCHYYGPTLATGYISILAIHIMLCIALFVIAPLTIPCLLSLLNISHPHHPSHAPHLPLQCPLDPFSPEGSSGTRGSTSLLSASGTAASPRLQH